jgi:pimeloyl-ACP methyl ester carboxylesterase
VLLHGFMESWRSWELVLPMLERRHDVLAVTLAGHAGGPPIESDANAAAVVAALERAMDAAGFATAHVAGNSLGGYAALKLAERGRARTVVAFAPAGGADHQGRALVPGGPARAGQGRGAARGGAAGDIRRAAGAPPSR